MDDLVERELLGEYDIDQVADAHLGIQYDVDGNPSQLIVAELGKGAFINDFAVVSSNMNIPATISVVCGTNCHLLALEKKNVETIVKLNEAQIFQHRYSTLSAISFFQKVSRQRMKNLIKESEIK